MLTRLPPHAYLTKFEHHNVSKIMIQICGVSRYCGRLVIAGTDPSKVTSHLLEPILLLSSASFLRSNLIPQPEQHADTPQYKT